MPRTIETMYTWTSPVWSRRNVPPINRIRDRHAVDNPVNNAVIHQFPPEQVMGAVFDRLHDECVIDLVYIVLVRKQSV